MRTPASSALLVLLVLGGCGDASSGADPARPAQWGACTVEELAAAGGEDLATLADPSGEPGVVRLVPPGEGPCAGLVARTGAGVEGLDVSGLDLEPASAKVVGLRGSADAGDRPTELLLVNGGAHPRGGFQPHLFLRHGGLAEVVVDGNPLLPFVATDGGGTPVTATCRPDGGVDVLTATPSGRPGVALAWDVQRTTYRFDGDTVVRTGTRQVRDHAADPALRKEMPELFEPDAFFADCPR